VTLLIIFIVKHKYRNRSHPFRNPIKLWLGLHQSGSVTLRNISKHPSTRKALSKISSKNANDWIRHHQYCIIGWVYFGLFFIYNKSTPKICYIPSKSTESSNKKFLDPMTASSLVTTFWFMHYIRVQNFLVTIWTSWVSKDAEFYVNFKNIN
jgi:hypothetical protein